MTLHQSIRTAFPEANFGERCTTQEIALAEEMLGHALPAVLKGLYQEFDGFTGPTRAPFLYPLLEPNSFSQAALVSHTKFLRGEDYFPPFMQEVIAFGDNGCGPTWLMFLNEPEKLVLWDAEWGDDYETLNQSILDVWLSEKNKFDDLSRRA